MLLLELLLEKLLKIFLSKVNDMDEKIGSVKLKCVFCFFDQFEVEEGVELKVGDMVTCANCGRLNDYEALLKVRDEEANKLVKDYGKQLHDKITKSLNNTIKGKKNINIKF